ncbi:hypothetical protein D3C72_1335490 [compost metagenome]
MDQVIREAAAALAEDAGHVIRIPARMAHEGAAECGQAGQRQRLRARLLQMREDFVAQGRRYAFVRIQAQDPVAAGGVDRTVFLRAEARPRVGLDHCGAGCTRNGHSVIRAGPIHYNRLFAPGHAFEAWPDIVSFIPGNDDGRDSHGT